MVHVAVISATTGRGTETLVLLWAAESENETQGAQKWAAMLLIFQSHFATKKVRGACVSSSPVSRLRQSQFVFLLDYMTLLWYSLLHLRHLDIRVTSFSSPNSAIFGHEIPRTQAGGDGVPDRRGRDLAQRPGFSAVKASGVLTFA